MFIIGTILGTSSLKKIINKTMKRRSILKSFLAPFAIVPVEVSNGQIDSNMKPGCMPPLLELEEIDQRFNSFTSVCESEMIDIRGWENDTSKRILALVLENNRMYEYMNARYSEKGFRIISAKTMFLNILDSIHNPHGHFGYLRMLVVGMKNS